MIETFMICRLGYAASHCLYATMTQLQPYGWNFSEKKIPWWIERKLIYTMAFDTQPEGASVLVLMPVTEMYPLRNAIFFHM